MADLGQAEGVVQQYNTPAGARSAMLHKNELLRHQSRCIAIIVAVSSP